LLIHDIHSQVKTREAIDFLLESEVMPLCLHSIEVGRELSKTVSFSTRYSNRFLLLCNFLLSLGCKIWNPYYYKDFYRQTLALLVFLGGKMLVAVNGQCSHLYQWLLGYDRTMQSSISVVVGLWSDNVDYKLVFLVLIKNLLEIYFVWPAAQKQNLLRTAWNPDSFLLGSLFLSQDLSF
jgi:hypothetical protein